MEFPNKNHLWKPFYNIIMNKLDIKHEKLDVSELIIPFENFSNENTQISILSKEHKSNSNHYLKSLLKKELTIINYNKKLKEVL